MADQLEVKISELPLAVQANDSDQLEANQAGVSRSITLGQVKSLIQSVFGTGVLAWLQNPTSANLAAAVPDETGTAGKLVFSENPEINGASISGTLHDATVTNSAIDHVSITQGSISQVSIDSVSITNVGITSPTITGTMGWSTPPLTANTPAIDIQQTWNNGAVNFEALKVRVTGTAQAFPSYLVRLMVDGGDRFNVDQFGDTFANGNAFSGGYVQANSGTAVPANGATSTGFLFSSVTNFGVTFAQGAPNTAMARGTLSLTNGSDGTPYVNRDGTPSGWSPLAFLASPVFTGDPQAPTPAPGDNDTSIATTAFVQAALGSFAPLASPTFTGDPKAPTPATADNDTSIATTAFVKAQAYAPLASPTFTGDPKAPTPATSDNDTSIATTAFVKAALSTAVGASIQRFAVSGTYTPHANLIYAIIECVGGGAGGGGTAAFGGNAGSSGGGGSGGYSRTMATPAAIGASQTVTIGAGGNGGAAGANNGSAGGDTSVGTLCIAKGGSPGIGSPGNAGTAGGAGGIAGTGDVTSPGGNGGGGANGTSNIASFVGGPGGAGYFGGTANSVGSAPGVNATAYGAGGSGSGQFNAGAAAAGGNGRAGLVIITEVWVP